jgi:hypothetical protein
MAVQLQRAGWTQMFSQMRSPNGFLSRFFTIKPGGVYNGDKVAIDIQRFGEAVAIAIRKSTGPNLNDFDQFTTKEFTPPAYGEAFPLDVSDLLNRMAGVDPYTAAYTEYAGQLVAMMAQGFTLVDDKIKRAVELQASQVLQTGKLILTDAAGATVYELDFKPKSTHFPNVAVAWSDAAAVPLADLEALAKIVRSDGKVNPDLLIMGESAISNFLSNASVIAQADNRRYELIEIAPQFMDSGATMYGFYWIGNYRFQLWSYPDTYDNPANGNPVPYVGTNNVIMLSTKTRLDMASARVPLPLGPDPRVAGLLPGRMTSRDAGSNFDVTPNVYATPNGKQIMGELESRPLMIPVQIDGYACLTTIPA